MPKERPAKELAEKLEEIIKAEGGLNLVAERADVSASSLSRAASGQQGVGKVTAARLEEAYGRRHGFTARKLLEWSLGAEPEPAHGDAAAEAVPSDVRAYWSRVQDEFAPEEREVARAMDALARKAADEFRERRKRLGIPPRGYEPPEHLT